MVDHTQAFGESSPAGDASAAARLGPGVKLKGRYLIESELGRGGIGAVYLARDEELLPKRVVIKVLLDEMVGDDWLKKKFQQEKEALARISHPGVVGVLDAGLTPDGQQFLVMEFVEGKSLAALIKPDGMAFDQAARILRQMGGALDAAHDEGVIHCDLKPANIMVQRPGEAGERVRVIDFGVAKVRDSLHARASDSTKVAGTPHYMAPEQIEGEPSASSDIFALGVIAYEMLTGRRPFNPRSETTYKLWLELIELQQSGAKIKPADLRTDLPEAAQGAILKALAFRPQDRFARAGDFTEALAEALTAPPADPLNKPPQPAGAGQVLEIAHVLFMDIVGYSRLTMDQQTKTIGQLQEIVRATAAFRRAQSQRRLISLPTGDGMALVFFTDPTAPVECAAEIARALKSQSPFGLRMGVHTGPVYRVADINTNMNVAGGGINIAQRVMDCGDAGHILLSKAAADMLCQLDAWAGLIHDLGECEVKHGVRVHLYNLYDGEAGNAARPDKLKKSQTNGRNRLLVAVATAVILLAIVGILWKAIPIGTKGDVAPKDDVQPTKVIPPPPPLELGVALEAQRQGTTVPLFNKIDKDGTINFDFNKGTGFRMQVTSPRAGYLYVLNVEKDIVVFFPSKAFRDGADELPAGQKLRIPHDVNRSRSDWLISQQEAREEFWIVWSAKELPALQGIQQLALTQQAPFNIDVPQQADSVRQFLNDHLSGALEMTPDAARQQVDLKANGDLLVVRLLRK